MKLFVMVLSLLSERYLIHSISFSRFNWFTSYYRNLKERLPPQPVFSNPWVILAIIVLPLVLTTALVYYLVGHRLYGLPGFLLNLFIFYYCLGPVNPFYPLREDSSEEGQEAEVANYFVKVNDQLIAVIFWYICLGPIAVLAYRLISLCKDYADTAELATTLTNWLNWIPARLTAFLCLLVGNFQRGFKYLTSQFFSVPENNAELISSVCMLAARNTDDEKIELPYAESLIEHALLVFLVLVAIFTMVAWL